MIDSNCPREGCDGRLKYEQGIFRCADCKHVFMLEELEDEI